MKYAALFIAVTALAVAPGTRDLIAAMFVIVFTWSIAYGRRPYENVDGATAPDVP